MTILNVSDAAIDADIGGQTISVPGHAAFELHGVTVDGYFDNYTDGDANLFLSAGGTVCVRSERQTDSFLSGFSYGIGLVVVLVLIISIRRGLSPSLERM